NPFNIKNPQLSDKEIDERLAHYKIPTDLPLVVQISRFDPWKDPEGVVKAFKLAREKIEARLVLLGNFATDDPEGSQIFESLRACQEERILILTKGDDTALVNALQSRAAVVVQKSLAEGFGLTVAEAMWKSRAVVASDVGGIADQIEDGTSGLLVEPKDLEAFGRAVTDLVNDRELAARMGAAARERIREQFLGPRHLMQQGSL